MGDAFAVSLRLGVRLITGLLVIASCMWVGSGLTTLETDEQAVVLRLGEPVEVKRSSGTIWAWPTPIGSIIRIPASERQFEIQIESFQPSTRGLSYVLTADARVLHVSGTLTWSITDPVRYVATMGTEASAAQKRTEITVQRLFSAVALRLVLTHTLDNLLMGEKGLLQDKILSAMRQELSTGAHAIGVQVQRIDLTRELPHAARLAFEAADRSTAEADSAVASAKQAAGRRVALARSEAAQVLTEAQARRSELISSAHITVNPIRSAVRAQDQADRQQQLERLYRDSLDRILATIRVQYVDDRVPVQMYMRIP